MSQLIDTLASYVPWLVTRRFAEDPRPLESPLFERFPAAVLFADISGVTRLSKELATRSAAAEDLTYILNNYFGSLIDLISAHGGDIVKFAGDGLYAIWPTIAHNEPLATVTLRAMQCAWEVRQRLSGYQVANVEQRLSMRIGVGAGEVLTATVGGVLKRWEFLLAGQPIGQINRASSIADPGEVVLSPEAWELVHQHGIGTPAADGHLRLEQLNSEIPRRLLPTPALAETAADGLRGFVAGAILARLDAGQVDWLAENRRVTVLFLNIISLGQSTPGIVERLQDVMQAMQVTLYHYEGSVRQFIMDDKGTVFIAAFGLPPRTHEDDPVRGVQAAIALKARLKEIGLDSSIGVATGMSFCGPVGNRLRREYALVGDIVYLSARLMVAAQDAILCDESTYQATNTRLRYSQLHPVQVKNRAEPVKVYSPHGKAQLEDSLRPIVGRTIERGLLAQQLEALARRESRIVVVEGDTGIGKSRLVAELRQLAEAQHFQVLVGEADAVDHATPYHAWRAIFSTMFQMESFTQTRSRSLAIIARMATDPELSRLAPLMKTILPVEIPENEFTETMTGEARAQNIRTLLLRLLQLNNAKTSSMVVLENAHWLDSASWVLALEVAQQVHPIILVIVTRPMLTPPGEFSELLQDERVTHIKLEPLTPADSLTLIRQRLEVAALPESIASLIYQKAEGNPFFTEQLVYTLRDSGYVEIVDGECRLAPGIEVLRDLNIPDTIQGVITSRIDRLTPQEQLALKVASTIGQSFLFRTLFDVYPIKSEKDQLHAYLNVLQKFDLIEAQAADPDLAYQFKHSISREVAYNLMLVAQRRELHEAIARWYERNFVYDLSPFYSLLAYHWQNAGMLPKAVDYLEKAAGKALRDGTYREVIDCLENAAQLEPANPSRQVRWAAYSGDAYWGLGQLRQSRIQAEKALELLGWPMPATRRKLVVGLIDQVIRQVCHRLLPGLFIGRTSENAANLLSAVRAYRRLQEVFYLSNQRLETFYAGFRGLNLAERAGGTTHELASMYANAAIGMGILRHHRQAEAFVRRANAVASKIDKPATTAQVAARTGIYFTSVGCWTEARDRFEQAVRLYDRIGDRRGLGDSLTTLAFMEYLHGNFKRSYHLYQELDRAAAHSHNREHMAWALAGRGAAELAFGNVQTAIKLLEDGRAWLVQTIDQLALINSLGMLSIAYQRNGNVEQALEAAQAAAGLILHSPPTGYVALGGYVSVPEVYLALWETEPTSQHVQETQTALEQLRRYVRIFPIGKPRLWLLTGRYHRLHQRMNKAFAAWEQGLKFAEALAMPYEKALVQVEIGRHLAPSVPQRRDHLQEAITVFEQLGTRYELERARAALR